MDQSTLRKVQLVQLEIAKEVKRICDENDIMYWLDSGTLLGAVRHKGFIPWDDDLDMGMKREDYEKFLKIAKTQLRSEYYLQEWESDKGYAFPFAKIRKNGTTYIENKNSKMNTHNGVYIDIFPYDVYGDNNAGQGVPLKMLKLLIQNKCGVRSWVESGSVNYRKLLGQFPFMVFSSFVSKGKIIKRYNKLAMTYNNEKKEFYFPQGISNYGKWTIPSECFGSFIEIPFEDDYFKVPKEYDLYLRKAYGDYMQLPPVEKRENRHQILEVKI